MGAGTLTIYSASAGSGKTFRLAGNYLNRLFSSRYSYRRILAVTFTNKATAEMKSRILEELNNLASGSESKYLRELTESTGKPEELIRSEANEILHCILHDFSRFYVSTIDSFFQKILRAFARDIGLHAGFNIEIDHSQVLSAAVDRLISSASSKPDVRKWLSEFVRANIEDEKTWDLRSSIRHLSEELFREKFKLLSPEEKTRLQDKDLLLGFIREMRGIVTGFKKRMKEMGTDCLLFFEKYSLTDDMFYYKSAGVPGFIRSIAEGRIKEPNKRVREIESNPPKWNSGKLSAPLAEAIKDGLELSVKEAIRYYDTNIGIFNSATIMMSNIYSLGILTDVLENVREITSDENIFLLSETGELIYLITGKDQAPFIYEKVGNIFESFMIDEFQDTSIIQWNNFSHLVENSMAEGGDNLVVGDIKQSIYRWRNSDWHTLSNLKNRSDGKRIICESLFTNYRSTANIIRFNNALFSVIPRQIDLEIANEGGNMSFTGLFSEVVQKDPGRKDKGLVRIEFVENNEISWRESVLRKLPGIIESLQDRRYRACDIGILVRNNREGADVLKYLIDYSSTCPDEKKNVYNYNIVSGDSLLLSNSPAVNFLTSVLTFIDDPGNMIARALMLRYYLISRGNKDADKVPLDTAGLSEGLQNLFPAGYEEFLESARSMTIWDITEKTIRFFGIGDFSFNVPYLNSFQDIVIGFTSGKNQGLRSFLDWWQTEGVNKSISLPEQQDSMQVMTIHKSKGLEFEIVILPFLSWNLDHKAFHSNILWVRPETPPFNKIPIVPVRYRKDLASSIFAREYYTEKYSAYIDNLNLLYVALTRARDAIFGFAPDQPGNDSRIAAVLKDAILSEGILPGEPDTSLNNYFDPLTKVFSFGDLPPAGECRKVITDLKIEKYPVNDQLEPLKLKLHWEDYFRYDESKAANMVNYGKLMHEVFGEISTYEDVGRAVSKKVLEGRIPAGEESAFCERINLLVNKPETAGWFAKGNEIINEVSILIPGADSKRPDRIIIRDGRATIVDFKFGGERPDHKWQISQYKKLLTDMGYISVDAYLWYVDADNLIEV